jgi:hypothetical protein
MKGFLLGLLVAGLAVGGYLFWKASDDGRSRAGAAAVDAGPGSKKRRKRPRGAVRLARARGTGEGRAKAGSVRPPDPAIQEDPGLEPEPEPIRLTAADRKMVGQGDDLGRPEVIRMDFESGKQLPELSQDDIDERFRAQEEAVLECISRARPDSEAYVPGVVNVKFRIQRTGAVRGVRVEGPAILMRGGLHPCVRGVVQGLRFPAAGSSQIVTYPFQLR